MDTARAAAPETSDDPAASDDLQAGFDAHVEDDMAGLAFVESDYAWVTQLIKSFADQVCEGRIVSILEGGYNLSALGRSAEAHVRALAGLKG